MGALTCTFSSSYKILFEMANQIRAQCSKQSPAVIFYKGVTEFLVALSTPDGLECHVVLRHGMELTDGQDGGAVLELD